MRRGTRRAATAAAALTLVAGLAAGCTGDPADPPTTTPGTPTASPSPSPTPTPTPDAATPPERPDMSTVDAATAEAVAVYFLELYPYVYATGDLTEWRALSHPECVFCASVITNVEEMVAAGHAADGGLVTVYDVAVVEVSDAMFAVDLEVTQSDGVEYDAIGNEFERSAGNAYLMTVTLLASDVTWAVRGVDVEESG